MINSDNYLPTWFRMFTVILRGAIYSELRRGGINGQNFSNAECNAVWQGNWTIPETTVNHGMFVYVWIRM